MCHIRLVNCFYLIQRDGSYARFLSCRRRKLCLGIFRTFFTVIFRSVPKDQLKVICGIIFVSLSLPRKKKLFSEEENNTILFI